MQPRQGGIGTFTAEVRGSSVSDIVVTATQQAAAHRVIEETQIVRLSADDEARLVDLLLNPPSLGPALLRAV